MKRESSQTMQPVAVREICSCHLESFVAGSADNMLKQTHMPQRCWSSFGLERGHAASALGRKPGLVLTRLSSAQASGFLPPSPSLVSRIQSTGEFIEMWPEILEPSNGAQTELLTLAIGTYMSLVELKWPW